jgi:hypothetical protein
MLPRDMGPGTPYQERLLWMRDPPGTWQTRKEFTQPPLEECRKDVLSVSGAVRVTPGLQYPQRASTRAELECIYDIC